MSLMCVYRCRHFVDINCRLQLYKLEAKKKKKIQSLSDKAVFRVIHCTPHIPISRL